VLVGICIDEDKETLTDFLKKEPMPWTHWWDGKRTVTEQWDIAAFPTLFVIDHQGVIRFVTQGYDPKSGKLEEMIKGLVKEAEAAK
jgi:protein-disulfide isomerase-like protein with CxxC motif